MQVPRLLVSVRSAAEASNAIRGGCDILDVKEPNRGSLGMADVATLHVIAKVVREAHREVMLTAALGEVYEFPSGELVPLPAELGLVKLGCAQLGRQADWKQSWRRVREAYSKVLSPTTGWVAVAYADWQLAESPPPNEIIADAMSTGCRGVLFDTYTKSSRRLLDWISVGELVEVAEKVRSQGKFLALAGSLRPIDLLLLKDVPADIIAIRGAACLAGKRTESVQTYAVWDFMLAMEQVWG